MDTFVRLLGRPEIHHEGRTTTLQPEVRFRLFAVLALQGAAQSRDRLAGLFWPDRDNATARRSLRKLVFDAGVFGWTTSIESTRATLCWPVATDVALFERALAERRYDDALSLYRGPLLDGLDDPANNTFAAFLERERRRLMQGWRTAALARLAGLRDQPTAALALANTLLAADPLDEEAIAAALDVLQSSGNNTEATRLYRSYAQRLADMLGIEPAARVRARAPAAEAPSCTIEPLRSSSGNGFVGREVELRELALVLGRGDCRLATIVGPGGAGKSRLAKAALAAIEPRFADGSWWIALDDLEKAEQVAERIVQMLGLKRSEAEDPVRCASIGLRDRRALLVLDNAERIVALPALVERLLGAAPGLKVMTTSRHRLGCAGEWLLPLAGLAVPPLDHCADDAADYDAVRLFAAHARIARASFDLSSALAPVVRIVRALGGLPLAIELAAQWLRLLPIAALETEIVTSLDLLERDDEGDERPEHSSVRATFEGSWRMLAPNAQRSLARLGVFIGSFSRRAANEVAGASLPLLAALADGSLLQAEDNARFNLHPLLQQFAREKCRALNLAETAARSHAHFFHRLLEQHHAACVAGDRTALDAIEAEQANVRAAWRWSIVCHDTATLARSAMPLLHFFLLRGRLGDGVGLFEEAMACLDANRGEDRCAAAHVQLALARLLGKRGCLRDAANTARRALKLGRALGLENVIGGCLEVFLESLWQRSLYPEARSQLDAGLCRARADDDRDAAVTFLCRSAAFEKAHGNHLQAQVHYAEALQHKRRLGEPSGLAWLLKDVGTLHCVHGEWNLALAAFREGLDVCERHGLRLGAVHFLLNLALVHDENSELEASDELFRRAFDLACAIDVPAIEAAVRLVRGRIWVKRGDTRAALEHVRTAAALILALRDERIGLDCVRSFAEVLIAAGAAEERRVAIALLNYVVRHPRSDASDQAVARAQLAQLAAQIDESVEPAGVAVGVLLRRIASGVPAQGAVVTSWCKVLAAA